MKYYIRSTHTSDLLDVKQGYSMSSDTMALAGVEIRASKN